jgi:hypothetical protein
LSFWRSKVFQCWRWHKSPQTSFSCHTDSTKNDVASPTLACGLNTEQ